MTLGEERSGGAGGDGEGHDYDYDDVVVDGHDYARNLYPMSDQGHDGFVCHCGGRRAAGNPTCTRTAAYFATVAIAIATATGVATANSTG